MTDKGVFIRSINGDFIPYDERAMEITISCPVGKKVLMRVHKARNPEHNGLAHAVFQKIAQAIGQPLDVVKLWLKWETGRVDLVKMPNGRRIANPRSFAFEAMSQDDFQAFWNDALPIIAEKVMPQMPQEVYEELRRMISGNANDPQQPKPRKRAISR